MINALITGSASGLGKEIYKALDEYRTNEKHLKIITENGRLFCPVGVDIIDAPYVDLIGDVSDKSCCLDIAEDILSSGIGKISILINCAGINHLSKFEDIKEHNMERIIRTNLYSILFMSQAFLDDLRETSGTIVNIISNASHMPMTHSFAYNASKGATHIATRQMARELTKEYNITVFGLSPNKLKETGMSHYIDNTFPPMRGMTYQQGRRYQLRSLLTGEETDPAQIAAILPHLLKEKANHEFLSGCILPMGL